MGCLKSMAEWYLTHIITLAWLIQAEITMKTRQESILTTGIYCTEDSKHGTE